MLLPRIAVAIHTALCAVLMSGTCARAADLDVKSAANDFIALLAFVGGTPLTQPERERLTPEIRAQLRTDRAGVERTGATVRTFLASLAHAEPWTRADQRETLRRRFELLPASIPRARSYGATILRSSSIARTSA